MGSNNGMYGSIGIKKARPRTTAAGPMDMGVKTKPMMFTPEQIGKAKAALEKGMLPWEKKKSRSSLY